MAVLKDGDAKDVEAWGIMGHCWGGKVATLISTEGTVFKAAAQCHPSLIEPSEAKNVVVPMAVLASGDEDKEVCFPFLLSGERRGGAKR
jgi:dienelactone hydrolase